MSQNSTRQGAWRFCQIAMVLFLLPAVLQIASVAVAEASNRLLLAGLDEQAETPTVLIRTAEPVGYRYTVYDSADPVRVVVDFPDMDLGDVAETKVINDSVVNEIRVSRLGLASGDLVRVEILLVRSSEYQISLDGGEFRVAFQSGATEPVPPVAENGDVASEPVVAPVTDAAATPVDVSAPLAAATSLTQMSISDSQAVAAFDGRPTVYREFTLTNPSRLVVDVLDVKPAFPERTFAAGQGFQQVRIGVDKVKTRLVFDADGELPPYAVEKREADLLIRWGADVPKVDSPPVAATPPVVPPAPVETVAAPPVEPVVVAPAVVAEPVEAAAPVQPVSSAPTTNRDEPPEVARPVSLADRMAAEAGKYSGEKISLVFDNADVRSILQLIGDVSGYNILASDDVKGSITLRLVDVPWDMALPLVLETAGLDKIQDGNVVRILPISKIREMKQAEQAAQKEELEVGPLVTRVLEVNYMEVGQVQTFLKDSLSDRGTIVPDAHNKQLIVKDVASVIDQVEEMIKIVDKPVRQVLIEARIVEASTTFSRDIGVKWNFDYQNDNVQGAPDMNTLIGGVGGSVVISPAINASAAGFATGINFGALDDSINVDLRLAALESTGDVKIISTPRVTTLNGEKAKISQGTSIPFSSTSSDGSTDVKFENADLSLEVTPEINPDGSILLEIKASNSAVGSVVPTATGSAVSIDTKEAQTKVMVRNGQTTVIGGIFVDSENVGRAGVPWLMSVPVLGHLFKSTNTQKERRELMIFITPRILES